MGASSAAGPGLLELLEEARPQTLEVGASKEALDDPWVDADVPAQGTGLIGVPEVPAIDRDHPIGGRDDIAEDCT
ncbi:MAG: hypothetical protein GY772_09480 [bacterium]|nr:hypothetical protein [bacterium]